MDLDAIKTIWTVVGALISAVSATIAWLQAKAASDRAGEAKLALDAATRQADAAEKQAAVAMQAADALKRQADAAEASAKSAAEAAINAQGAIADGQYGRATQIMECYRPTLDRAVSFQEAAVQSGSSIENLMSNDKVFDPEGFCSSLEPLLRDMSPAIRQRLSKNYGCQLRSAEPVLSLYIKEVQRKHPETYEEVRGFLNELTGD